jgi:hypothetical protein
MYFPIEDWLAAFLMTLAIEAPIVLALLRSTRPDLVRLGILVVFVNLATHLAVWYVFTQVLLVGTPQYTLTVEAWAVAAEALFYWAAVRGLSARRAVAIAVVANGASFVVGWSAAFCRSCSDGSRRPDRHRPGGGG